MVRVSTKLTVKQIADGLDKYSDMLKADSGREANPKTSMLSTRGVRLRDIADGLDEVIARLDDLESERLDRGEGEIE